jgi:serine/threonine protein kinase
VKVYGACTRDRQHVSLIMELMEGGSLHQRIYDRCKRRMGYLEILQVGRPSCGAPRWGS